MHNERAQRTLRSTRRALLGTLLAGGALVRCECEEETFEAAAAYVPEAVLDFGPVAVSSERTLPIVVRNEGRAALRLLSVTLENDPSNGQKFKVKVDPELMSGVTPSQTASITVTYRPCPEAWTTVTVNGQSVDLLKEGFNYDTCPTANDSADLVTVEDKTRDGGARILLSGQPVQPPSIEVVCQNSQAACNMPAAQTQTCTFMNFGAVVAGETPCDLVVEVRNKYRGNRPVGELRIEGIDIKLQRLNPSPLPTTDGAELGFTVHAADGTPLALNPEMPLVAPAPVGAGVEFGMVRFRVRYAGLKSGLWFGNEQNGMTGIRLYTNDPNNPVVKIGVSGTGSSPDIGVQPPVLNFGPVEMGRTKTLSATITNSGEADLRISSLGFMNDRANAKFRVRSPMPTPFVVPPNGGRVAIAVDYTPPTPGQDEDALLIGNNDLKTMGTVSIPITGGAVPRISVEPPDTLVFSLDNPRPPPPVPPKRLEIGISNVGFGDLLVQRLQITGPGGDPAHPSADDFRIEEANGANPWDANITLCPPSNPSCTMGSVTLHVIYQNNDISTIDLAELHIRSSDPTDMDHVVVLNAEDVPCRFPVPTINVITPRPCKGRAVEVDAASSDPGGLQGTTTITSYDWSWVFAIPAPMFTANGAGAVRTMFTPTEAGIFILGLDVTNDCGQTSQASANETINVAETCN